MSTATDRRSVLATTIEGIAVLSPYETLRHEDVPALDEAFAYAFSLPGPVILDLDGFVHIPSSAIVIINSWARRFKEDKRRFVLSSTEPSCQMLLKEGRALGHIESFSSLSAAVRNVRPGARGPLGEILMSEFGLARHELLRALRRQDREGGILGHILLVHQAIKPMDLGRALALQQARAG